MATRRTSPAALEGEIVESESTEGADSEGRPIHLIKVTDEISVWAREPSESQLAAITKSSMAAQRDLAGHAVYAMDVVFRVITAILHDPNDIKRLDSALIEDEVTVKDLLKILGVDSEDAKPAAKKSVRRRV